MLSSYPHHHHHPHHLYQRVERVVVAHLPYSSLGFVGVDGYLVQLGGHHWGGMCVVCVVVVCVVCVVVVYVLWRVGMQV